MTRSIFDPTGDETERGRSQFLGPNPAQHSKMPPAAVDGKDEAKDERAAEDEDVVDVEQPNPTRADIT